MSGALPEFELVVTEARSVAVDVLMLTLRAADPSAGPLPEWLPGAHLDVRVQPGVERQYSLCGDPADREHYRIAVLREPDGRGGSEHLHAHAAAGTVLTARGPLNHFALVPPVAGARYEFVAGGIGITPLLPMLDAVSRAGAEFVLHYAGRSLERMPFVDELVERYGDAVSVYAADAGRRLDLGAFGRELAGVPDSAAPGFVYCCGPARMLAELEAVAVSAGWPASALHLERFEAREATEPVRHESFEVELELSGMTLEVPPDRTILDVVEEAGVLVLSSCREGTCGTCETPVVSGEVDHRDSVLTPAEQESNEVMMICVSRAACPRLVLEL
ncbi:PDR/VanB family oxidoreductase [Herbiconiux solani]|uniref:PDR/VanB family oxidoreductase n=1 Tax=Herbiconiux solani TaxID=661329 RepID=UPI000AAE3D5D|nr:PDR/VanB family oxidoreductase [Herbiconiux solani]